MSLPGTVLPSRDVHGEVLGDNRTVRWRLQRPRNALTDHRQFDILQSDSGWWEPNAVRSIELIGLLVLIHYFLRFKLMESTRTFATGLFGWLIGYRLLVWWRKTGNGLPTWMLFTLSVIVAGLTLSPRRLRSASKPTSRR